MDITSKVKRLLLENDMTAYKLAEKIGTSQPNMSYKMKYQSYSVMDLIKISEALNCTVEINFILPSGEKV